MKVFTVNFTQFGVFKDFMAATIKDIAKKIGVTHTTVSLVLNRKNTPVRISKATIDKVLEAAKELNYTPNSAARQLAGVSSKLIGAIIDSKAPTMYYDFLSGIERGLASNGYRFMIGQSHGEWERVRAYIDDFHARGIEGVVCVSYDYDFGTTAQQIAEQFGDFKNLIFLGEPKIETNNYCCVMADIENATYQAVTYLFKNKRKNIGIILTSHKLPLLKRLNGYKRAVSDNQKKMDEELILWTENPEKEDVYLNIDKLKPLVLEFIKKKKVDALICCNDCLAAMSITILRENGIRVPNDIAVIGYDNTELSKYTYPTLTTIDQRSDEMAKHAVNILMKMINKETILDEERKKIIQPKLIIRNSA